MTAGATIRVLRAAAAAAALVLVLLSVPLGTAVAQTSGAIQQIVVTGNQRIEPSTIVTYMSVRVGDPFDVQAIDDSLKSLFATGLFADVTIRREGDALIVQVVENPIINRIAFEGNKKISDETLNAEVQLRPRVVYTRTRVQNDVKRILEVYRRSGRFAATVEPKVIPLPQNRVDLVFEINEGAVTGVQRITFIGNRVFDSDRLREVVQTVESAWWRILTQDDTYDPDRLNYDKELLRRFYLANGYADFRVVSAVAELVPDKEGFYLTFTVEEGERYKFGSIKVVSTLRNLEGEQLSSLVKGKEGDWYNADQVDKTIEALTDEVGRFYEQVETRTAPRVPRSASYTDLLSAPVPRSVEVMPIPIVALALTAFALGTAELVPNGLLPLISGDLGISVPMAGWVTTSFALGAVIVAAGGGHGQGPAVW